MFRAVLLTLVAATSLAEPIPPEFNLLNPFTPNGRIVGGEPVSIVEVPYQVSLQFYGFGFCGGSIIDKEWIVTAAHCAVYSASSVTVRAGTHTMTSGGSLHPVARFITHPNYRTNAYGIPINDVALVQLAAPLELDEKKRPIEMFELNEESVAGSAALITGWGSIREGGGTTETLRKVSIPVVSKEECSNAYSSFGGVPSGQICAAYPQGGKDACQGDSGGPMVIAGRLAGITSWGNGCARPKYPGVYTEIASFRSWIKATTGV